MTDILNLTLKKDVFEGLRDGTSNTIFIEKSDWWKRRLKDKNGEFKPFTTVRVSSGSKNKIDYPILKIKGVKGGFEIIVDVNAKLEDSDVDTIVDEITPVNIPDEVNEVDVEPKEESKEEPLDHPLDHPEEDAKNESLDLSSDETKDMVNKIVSLFCDLCDNNNTFVVSTPIVIIKSNGQVIGTNRYISGRIDTEMRFNFQREEFVKYRTMTTDLWIESVRTKIDRYLDGNYVFVKKNSCKFEKRASGEDVFVMKLTTRKKYLLR